MYAQSFKNELKQKARESLRTQDIMPKPDAAQRITASHSDRVRVAIYLQYHKKPSAVTKFYSVELHKYYLMQEIERHSNWINCGVFTDVDVSSEKPAFEKILQKCQMGEIDLILTKSIRKFTFTMEECISTLNLLHAMEPAVGVFFEYENLYSLDDPMWETKISFAYSNVSLPEVYNEKD